MTKKYQICHHQIRFFKLKMHQIRFRWGSLRRSPDPIVGCGRGIPPPHSTQPQPFHSPLDAFGVSNSAPTAPRFSCPPQHKILATPVFRITCVALVRCHETDRS